MEITDKIHNIIERILESEKEWKALYMASWGCVYFYLEPKFKNTENWDKPLRFGLPASKKKFQEYKPSELCGILKSKDEIFTLGYLQTIFSLFEELVKELCFVVCSIEIRADKFEELRKFLIGDNPYNSFQVVITEDEMKELKLAKETRNCFIHNNSKVDQYWMNALRNSNNSQLKKINIKIGDALLVSFNQIEDWNELILNIVDRINNWLSNK